MAVSQEAPVGSETGSDNDNEEEVSDESAPEGEAGA
jgi:hypothetical protein